MTQTTTVKTEDGLDVQASGDAEMEFTYLSDAGDGKPGGRFTCTADDNGLSFSITLSRNDLHWLDGMIRSALQEGKWQLAEWVVASEGYNAATDHMMRKDGRDPQGAVLCGRRPPKYASNQGWTFEPFIGTPMALRLCKSCDRKFRAQSAGKAQTHD